MNHERSRVRGWMGWFPLVLATACSTSGGLPDVEGARGETAEAEVHALFPEAMTGWAAEPSRFARRAALGREPVFVSPESGAPKAITVEVPEKVGQPVVVRGRDGFSFRVWDDERTSRAVLTRSGLSYGRKGGGTSFWTALDSGAEEWLLFPDGARSREVARYRIEGGDPRQHDWAIDVYDEAGAPRVTITAPQVLSAKGVRVDAKMVLQGDIATVVLTTLVPGPLLVDPVFVPAGDMSGDRKFHEALLLPSGRVMVLGGYSQVGLSPTNLKTMEFFDPATGTWSNGPSAASTRVYPTLTRLLDGRILAVSETYPQGPEPGTEIFDEVTNTWQAAAQPATPRSGHSAVLLEDGRVLVAGNYSYPSTSSELYDPGTDTWTSAGSTSAAHSGIALHRTSSGEAVMVGHIATEQYSPAVASWAVVANAPCAHVRAAQVQLPNGSIFASGGSPPGPLQGKCTALFDPAAQAWQTLAPMPAGRPYGPATLLPDGTVLVTGDANPISGFLYATSVIYDFATNAWSPGPTMNAGRAAHSQTLLPDGRVLVAAGYDTNTMKSLRSTELLSWGAAAGAPCAQPPDCQSNYCVDGVCCDSLCAGACFACSVALGAALDGTCAATSNPCDDGDACTTGDSCVAGVCVGTPVLCADNATDCLSPATCDAASGQCVADALPDGSPCVGGVCTGGTCMPGGSGGNGGGGAGAGGVGGDASSAGGGPTGSGGDAGGSGSGGHGGVGVASGGSSSDGGGATSGNGPTGAGGETSIGPGGSSAFRLANDSGCSAAPACPSGGGPGLLFGLAWVLGSLGRRSGIRRSNAADLTGATPRSTVVD